MVSSQVLALAVALAPLAAQAANDWSQACLSGSCDWDIPSGSGTSGTVRVTGSNSSISDLTEAAGWTILDCDGSSADQDIRVVCGDSSLGCDHLYNNGAEYTVVRLPDECAAMPFALVTREWKHANQSIPASKRSLLMRSDGTFPAVRGISLGTNFSSAQDASQHGDVVFFVQGSSVEGIANDFIVPPNTDDTSVREWISNTTLAMNTLHANTSAVQRRSLSPRVLEINATKHDFSYTLPDVTIFDTSLDCPQVGDIPGFSAAVDLGAGGSIDGTVTFGFAFAGNIFDLKNFDFGLLVGLDSVIDATLQLDAALTGTFSIKQTLYSVGLPGLDIPGILTIGPMFSVIGGAKADLDTAIDMGVDLAYTISGAQLVFPPLNTTSGNSTQETTLLGGSFIPGDNNIKLSATPNVTAHGNITGHLIPQLAFGITALGGQASATVNLNVDASAGLSLSLETGAVGDVSASSTNGTSSSGSGDVAGCVDIITGLGINIGADADLFDVFTPNVTFPIFSGSWDLFQKCWATSSDSASSRKRMTTRRRGLGAREAAPAVRARDVDWLGVLSDISDVLSNGLVCPTAGLQNVTDLVTQAVSSASL